MCSTDSESPSSSLSEFEPCQVCGQSAIGNHFGAFTCRACAAFFRRAALGRCLRLVCREASETCEAYRNGKLFCKKCRYELCLKVGMTPDKFQYDRDLISTNANFVVARKERTMPVSIESFFGRPHFLIMLEPTLASQNKTVIDVSYLLSRATQIFNNGMYVNSEKLYQMNTLERMTFGFNSVREPRTKNVKTLKTFGKDETLTLWENELLMVAKWLTYCDEYMKLPTVLKVNVLKRIWNLWIRLEKLFITAECRTKNECAENETMVSNEYAINCDDVDVDVSWFTNYSKQQLAQFMDEHAFHEEVMRPLKKLQPTQTEKTYMLFQLCSQYVGKIFQGSILEASDRMHEVISNDLHNYYTNELRMTTYSGRLAQLMKINYIVMRDMMERHERNQIARVFDVFKVDFSHPEMFYGPSD